MLANNLYSDREYKVLNIGTKKIILSVLDALEIGELTDLGYDFSNSEVVIFADNIIVSKKLKAKSIRIFSHTIVLSEQEKIDSKSIHEKKIINIPADNGSDFLEAGRYLELFDYSNSKYLSVSVVKLLDGILSLEEQMSTGGNIDLCNFMFAHPTQCVMLLQKAQLLYRKADNVENKADLEKAFYLLNRLRSFTEKLHDADDQSDLAKLYRGKRA